MNTLCKGKFKRIIWAPFLIIIAYLFCLAPGVMASFIEIDDFNGAAGPPSGTWSTTIATMDSETQVADPDPATTPQSCSITGNGDVQIDWAAPGENWTLAGAKHDIGFFVHGDNGSQTIVISIDEWDNLGAGKVKETWSKTITGDLNWKGWKYFGKDIGAEFSHDAGGDGIWNPDVKVSDPVDPAADYDGVTQVKFTIGNNTTPKIIYIDEIYVSSDGSALTVYQIFPIDDVVKVGVDVDITVDWPPPTVSAVFDWDPTINSTIRLVNEGDVTNCLNSNIEFYSASVGGLYGIFATPDTPLSAGTYTIFIVPCDGTSRGVAEVVRFTVSDTAGTPDVETKHSGTRMY